MGGGSGETVDTAALRQFAARFESEVGAKLADAAAALQGGVGVEYSNFSTFAWPLATAYVEAANFAQRDLRTKSETVASFAAALRQTADDWDRAEQAGTVRTTH